MKLLLDIWDGFMWTVYFSWCVLQKMRKPCPICLDGAAEMEDTCLNCDPDLRRQYKAGEKYKGNV